MLRAAAHGHGCGHAACVAYASKLSCPSHLQARGASFFLVRHGTLVHNGAAAAQARFILVGCHVSVARDRYRPQTGTAVLPRVMMG